MVSFTWCVSGPDVTPAIARAQIRTRARARLADSLHAHGLAGVGMPLCAAVAAEIEDEMYGLFPWALGKKVGGLVFGLFGLFRACVQLCLWCLSRVDFLERSPYAVWSECRVASVLPRELLDAPTAVISVLRV